jgi:hypothetical protein
MKVARFLLAILLGAFIGVGGTIAFQKWRRSVALHMLPNLSDRHTPPAIDEFPHVLLSRRDGKLFKAYNDGLGHPRTLAELLKMERQFGNAEPIFDIQFELGVTMQDIDEAAKELSDAGVTRLFLQSIYGKSTR